MRRIIFLLSFVLVLLPVFVFADCNKNGTTVVYINGIFTSDNDAKIDLLKLQTQYENRNNISSVKFLNGYNSTHIKGFGDVLKSVIQAYGVSGADYDLTNILRQVHNELTTRKVLLVGHSQGTFYTNAAYDYLIKNRVSKDSIFVYNVATPVDKVAGNGSYLTSGQDKVINVIVRKLTEIGFAHKPLPANIDMPAGSDDQDLIFGGHSFSKTYLAGAPDRIIGDMRKQLDGLSSADFSGEKSAEDCFVAPKTDLVYKIKSIGFAIADGIANNSVYLSTGLAADYLSQGLNYVYNFGKEIVSNLERRFSAALSSAPQNKVADAKNSLTAGQHLNKAAPSKTFLPKSVPPDKQLVIDGKQEQTDDILEKIDLLNRQIADFKKAEQEKDSTIELSMELNRDKKNQNQEQNPTRDQTQVQNQNQEQNQNLSQNQNEITLTNQTQKQNKISYHGGGGNDVNTTYSKILISEVQIAGTSDKKEEFVELYNPNNQEVNLTGWYIHKKTKTASSESTFASNTLFNGKKINSNSYFLVAKQGYFTSLADIFVDNSLAEDDTLILKNPNGEIADKVGWGQAKDFETAPAQNPSAGQSLGRKQDERDSDNNSADFELNSPTPKAQNKTYAALPSLPPPPPPIDETKDSTAPKVSFNFLPIQNNLNFTVNFTITDMTGVTSGSGVSSYVFRWKEETNDWQEDAVKNVEGNPAIFSGTKDFLGNDEKNYYFQIKAKDAASNESDWLPSTLAVARISLPKKILINEIQIDSVAGKGGADDDWVELYNPNDMDVSLANWSIQKHSSDEPCSINKSFYKKSFDSNAKIPAKGFFLIVGNQANNTLKSIADMTIGWTLTDNNTVYLARSQDKITGGSDPNIIDKVGFSAKSCFPETNPAPNLPEAKSIERKKLGLDTDENSQDFKVSDEPTPKSTFPKVILEDATDYSANLSGMPANPVYNLLLKWQSLSQNIDFYQIQFKLNSGNWQDWLTQTTKTQDYFQGIYSLINDNVYYFRAKAQDKDGNLGNWSDEIKIDLTNPVLINEVAYAGTNADSKDQWIELYNRTDKDIDLTGWKIVSGSGGKDDLNLSLKGTILAKGYFILEANDNSTISDISADQLFLNSLGKNYLYLRAPNNRYVDEFYSAGFDPNSFIKDSNHYSAERVSAYSFGFLDKNWKLNDGKTLNGKDRNQSQIYGTPSRKNSVNQTYTYYSSGFLQNTILKKEFSPYLLQGMDTQVLKDVNLTIEPGVVVKFYDNRSGLFVSGTLKVLGTDTDKIIFTSFKDDEFSGDSNGDGNATLPSPGDWLSLYFQKDSQNSQLENVDVRYGGAILGFSPPQWGKSIWVDQTSISLKNSVVEKNKNIALDLSKSDSIIDSVKFLDNSATDSSFTDSSYATYIRGGSPQIKNSYFENSYFGIDISSFYDVTNKAEILAYPTIKNNNFVKNTYPIFWGLSSYPTLSGNQATDNKYDAILFYSDIAKDITLKPDLPYLIRAVTTVPESVTLSLEPGVIVDFQNDSNSAGLKVEGTLKAIGLPDNPVIFRPYYGKDWVKPGSWMGLYFTKNSKDSRLENVSISYGGNYYADPSNQYFTAGIKVDQSSISLKNSVLQKNANNGVWLVNSPSNIDSVQFLDQNLSTVSLEAKGVYIQGGNPIIKNSNFKNNYYGIYIDNWRNPDTDKDILGEPVLENNKFEGKIKADIFNINSP